MLKVIAACGNGMGSSLIIKMKISNAFKKLGIKATVDHMSVGEAKSACKNYDVVFCSKQLTKTFDGAGDKVKIIGLQNLLSEEEITTKIKENIEVEV